MASYPPHFLFSILYDLVAINYRDVTRPAKPLKKGRNSAVPGVNALYVEYLASHDPGGRIPRTDVASRCSERSGRENLIRTPRLCCDPAVYPRA